MTKTKLNKPTMIPQVPVSEIAEMEHPSDAFLEDQLNDLLVEDEVSSPKLQPPEGGIFAMGEDAMATAWGTHKILGMWSNLSNKNTWIALSNGVGWKKLSNSNNSAHRSLVAIAQGAYITNSSIRYRLESDNEIHEIYAW